MDNEEEIMSYHMSIELMYGETIINFNLAEDDEMRRTIISLIIMIASSCVGLVVGGLLNNDMVGGMILFALISGIACIIHTLDNRK